MIVRQAVPLAVAGCVAAILGAPLPAQEAPAPTRWRTGAAEIELGGRVHTQFNTTSAEDQPVAEMILRRVRLEARVRINELVSGRVQPDFAGDRVAVKDAYMRLDFSPAAQLLVGKAYRPFSLLEQVGSGRSLPVERGARLRGVEALDEYALVNGLQYSDRDVGAQLHGSLTGLPLAPTYQVGYFGGPLQGRTGSQDTHQLAARATVRPAERLQMGAAWSSRDFAGATPEEPLRRGNAVSVDFQYGAFAPGLHLLGELAAGDYDPYSDRDFVGAQGWLAYRTRPRGRVTAIEPLLRASYGRVSPPTPVDPAVGGLLLTPGINLYLGGLNRVMLNYDHWSPVGGARTHGGIKAQFQLAF